MAIFDKSFPAFLLKTLNTDSKVNKIMTCNCEDHLEQFTCSGVDCMVCVLGEENYIENPEFSEERYCLECAKKKGGFTTEELWQLMMANPNNNSQCGSKSH